MILWRTSLGLERLSSLNLFLKDIVLSLLCILDLLFNVDLQVLFWKSLLFSGDLGCTLDFFGIGLGLFHGIICKLFLLQLSLLKSWCDFILGQLGFFLIHSELGCLIQFLSLLLCLLNDGADKLWSLLDSDLHPLIKVVSNLDRLLFDIVRSSLPCSRQSLIRDLTNFLGLLLLSQFSSLIQFLLNRLKCDWSHALLVEQPLANQILVGRIRLLKRNFN